MDIYIKKDRERNSETIARIIKHPESDNWNGNSFTAIHSYNFKNWVDVSLAKSINPTRA